LFANAREANSTRGGTNDVSDGRIGDWWARKIAGVTIWELGGVGRGEYDAGGGRNGFG
jgi:hypothetical protein